MLGYFKGGSMRKINVLSLFDGMSCGQLALSRLGIEVENYYAAEIDTHAIKVTQHNFPNTIQLGDVTRWEDWGIDFSSIDLVTGGFPCFPADTLVTTSEGLVKIQDVKRGDMVLTHNNRFKKVVVPMVKVADHINKLKIQGCYEISATDEHPFYVRSVKRAGIGNKRVFSEPIWKAASDLSKGDFIGIAINKESKIPHVPEIQQVNTRSFWHFIGRYLADGYSSTPNMISRGDGTTRRIYKVVLTCGHHEFEIVKTVMDDTGFNYCVSKERTSYKFTITSKQLWTFIQSFGRGASSKRLPGYVFDLPVDLIESLIDGYLGGDGYKVKERVRGNKNQYGITSVSLELLTGFQALIHKAYRTHPSISKSIVPETKVIEGRVVNQMNFYTLRFNKEVPKQACYHVEGDYIWTPFKNITREEKEILVYNFEVEEDNSYCVHNFIAHNCQSWSMSGKRLGDKDPRGALFWTTLEVIKKVLECNPNAKFLLENVKMKKDFEQYITHHTEQALGTVHKILINSSLVSAQNRNRNYWTNIPNITQPEDKKITWGDVRDRGVNGLSYYYTEQAMQWLARHSQSKKKVLTVHQDADKMQMLEASHCKKYSSQRFFGIPDLPTDQQAVASMRGRFLVDGKRQDGKMKTAGLTKQYVEFRYDGKTNTLSTVAKDNIVVPFTLPNRIPVDEFFFRYITPEECEKLQTVPVGYTACVSNTQRLRMLGNGWTVDVIVHILQGIKKDFMET